MAPLSQNLLLLLLVLNSSIPFVFCVTLYDVDIIILNYGESDLTTHCKTNGVDIGTTIIKPSDRQRFKDHVLVRQRSLASCDMTLGNRHGQFDVFDSKRGDLKRCADRLCLWMVQEDGLFLFIDLDHYELIYKWP